MNKIFDNGNYIIRSHIASLPPDSFHLKLTSQLLTAKDPQEQHTLFDVTLERRNLAKLRDIIDIHLTREML